MSASPTQGTHGYHAWGLCFTVCHSSGKVPSLPILNIKKGVLPWNMELLPKYHLTQKCTRLEFKVPFEKPAASHPKGEILPLSW